MLVFVGWSRDSSILLIIDITIPLNLIKKKIYNQQYSRDDSVNVWNKLNFQFIIHIFILFYSAKHNLSKIGFISSHMTSEHRTAFYSITRTLNNSYASIIINCSVKFIFQLIIKQIRSNHIFALPDHYNTMSVSEIQTFVLKLFWVENFMCCVEGYYCTILYTNIW